jgi:hypothetical protein
MKSRDEYESTAKERMNAAFLVRMRIMPPPSRSGTSRRVRRSSAPYGYGYWSEPPGDDDSAIEGVVFEYESS